MAKVLGCESRELIFTSGGSEADNLAIRGVASRNRDRGNHIICSQVEHHAVLHTCQDLERHGFEVTYLAVDRYGRVSVDALAAALRPDTLLVSVMTGSNEVGTLEPVRELAALTHEKSSAYFHTDAVQAFGKVPVAGRRPGRRPAHHLGAQDLWPQGRWLPLRAHGHPDRPHDHRRRP